jgi:transposase
MHRLQELIRLHRRGLRARHIARLLRMGRNTVARYSEALRAAGLLGGDPADLPDMAAVRAAVDAARLPSLPRQQQSSIERWLPIVDAKCEAGVGPTAIYDFLRLEYSDFSGSLSAVKRRCAALQRAKGVRPEDVTMPVDTEPGDVAQVDFGYVGKLYDPDEGVMRKAWVFVMTLGHSRHMAARIVFDQKTETWPSGNTSKPASQERVKTGQ